MSNFSEQSDGSSDLFGSTLTSPPTRLTKSTSAATEFSSPQTRVPKASTSTPPKSSNGLDHHMMPESPLALPTNVPFIISQMQRMIDIKKLEKVKSRKYKQDEFTDIFQALDLDTKSLLYYHFPPLKFVKKPKKKPQIIDTIMGPYDPHFVDDAYTPWVYGRAISTYPHLPTRTIREGDPICDSYCIQLLEDNMVITVVADGCSWGKGPMEASNTAKSAFVDYLRSHLHEMNDLRDVGHYLLQALSACQFKITEGKDQWEAGTTTLLGGVLIPVKKEKKEKKEGKKKEAQKSEKKEKKDKDKMKTWVWAFVTIGDCKSYHFNKESKAVTDLTEGNRQNVFDAKDCGGRLGPQVEEGAPDLRNVSLNFQLCSPGDIILILSDGVHDNLDPQTLGKVPADLGPKFSSVQDWNDIESLDEVQNLKTQYMLKLLSEDLICGGQQEHKLRTKVFSIPTQQEEELMSPNSITTRIIQFCLSMTGNGREWMEQNPREKLPNDYIKYPGKMDHATCVTMKVGRFDVGVPRNRGGHDSRNPSTRNLKESSY
ncbi:protein phosphatase 2C-related protein [Planoprotostelium fungivorum]|uniref:Protein phosphatase 2C-related protein n=1 Tax=Planoprotostelium fungivorum TaxID=1890364 RepID=A0A2P6NAB4_9EUKA|nr:protein phosphatase 2C-related protein [Planoprotostelium fungivorum]